MDNALNKPAGASRRAEAPAKKRWSLRPGQATDREFLFELNRITMHVHVERVWGWDETEQARFFEARFEPDAWQIIRCSGEDIGVLIVEESNDEIYLAEIQIFPTWQRHGIGSAIVRSLMARAAKSGRPLTLRVVHVNEDARRLYERLGFRPYKSIATHV